MVTAMVPTTRMSPRERYRPVGPGREERVVVEVVVREAELDDVEAAAAVYVSSAEHHHALDPEFYRVPAIDVVASHYRELLRQDPHASVLLLAEVGGRIVGSCQVTLLPEPNEASMLASRRSAELDVATVPGSRRRGVGSALMADGERLARDRGVQLLMLSAHAANEDAIRFYTERHSYRHVGVVLSKELAGEPSGR
jgi:ribosomal protein S18 acetylase RimI-like enzyme